MKMLVTASWLSSGTGSYSPLPTTKFHGARGLFLMQLGRTHEAKVAFDRAIALANTPAEAAHIRQQLDQLFTDPPVRGRARPIA